MPRRTLPRVLAREGRGTGPQGWCVLADGERGLKEAGKALRILPRLSSFGFGYQV